jgi:hypothetical protein
MVKHIVLFKLTSFNSNKEKELQLKQMDEIFSALPEQLKYIIEFRTGCNFTKAPHAWDFAIDSVFRNREDLQSYQISPEHQNAIQKASHILKNKAVVDYEILETR